LVDTFPFLSFDQSLCAAEGGEGRSLSGAAGAGAVLISCGANACGGRLVEGAACGGAACGGACGGCRACYYVVI